MKRPTLRSLSTDVTRTPALLEEMDECHRRTMVLLKQMDERSRETIAAVFSMRDQLQREIRQNHAELLQRLDVLEMAVKGLSVEVRRLDHLEARVTTLEQKLGVSPSP